MFHVLCHQLNVPTMFQTFPNIWPGTPVGQWRQALGLLHLIAANLQRRIVAVQISRICSDADGQNLNLLCPIEDQFPSVSLLPSWRFISHRTSKSNLRSLSLSILLVGVFLGKLEPQLDQVLSSIAEPLACTDRADDGVPFWHLVGECSRGRVFGRARSMRQPHCAKGKSMKIR